MRIALSTKFPFTGFRARLHPEISAAINTVADQLEAVGHTIMSGDPTYGLRLSWSFLARSTAGLLDWADRVGDDVTLDPRTVSNLRLGRLLSGRALDQARPDEAIAARRSARIFNFVDVVLAPTTALPPPRVRAFDDLGTFRTDRTMICAAR